MSACSVAFAAAGSAAHAATYAAAHAAAHAAATTTHTAAYARPGVCVQGRGLCARGERCVASGLPFGVRA